MQGPLSPDMYDTARWPESWWRASAPEWEGPAPLAGPAHVEMAIIGGGYAGLACAIRLAELGHPAMVLEAGEIGWGASGRNGGIVGLESHKLSHNALVRRCGADEVARYHAAQLEGLHRLRAFCAEAGVPVQGEGEIILAHSHRTAKALSRETPPEGVSFEAMAPVPGTDMAQFGGIRISPGFGVHPLRLVRALADRAVELGVAVHPQTEVLRWRPGGPPHVLETRSGEVTADRVVIATNGFTPDGLHPGMERRAVPVISNIAVTRPLSEDERARHAWLGDDPVADTRNLLVYLRMLPEGRLLLGMRGDLTGAEVNTRMMKARVADRIADQFPGWRGIEITHFWRGPICATASYTPAVGPMRGHAGVFHAFGWHGSGVNGAQVGGRLLAEVIAGTPETHIPAPFRGRAPALPVARLRPAYVGAALLQQRLADALT